MKEIKINPKPVYVPLHLQSTYRVSQILLILNINTGTSKSATISLLQTIAWSMRDKQNMKILIDYKSNLRNTLVPWCFEPALDKALIIALVNEYCTRQVGGKIKLTSKGKKVIDLINENNLFIPQIEILENIGDVSKIISEKQNWKTR